MAPRTSPWLAPFVTLDNDYVPVTLKNKESWQLLVTASTVADNVVVSLQRTVASGGKGGEFGTWTR